MKMFFSVLALVTLLAPAAFAGKSMSICDRDQDAPQCAQARPKNPKNLPESYTVDAMVSHAQAAFAAATGEQAGQATCTYANTHKVAFACQFVSSAGRACQLNLLQVWSNADYQLNCQGGVSIRKMVNPGPVPPTMD